MAEPIEPVVEPVVEPVETSTEVLPSTPAATPPAQPRKRRRWIGWVIALVAAGAVAAALSTAAGLLLVISTSVSHDLIKNTFARAINDRLMPLHKNLFIESNPIPVKWALREMGLIQQGIRLPLTWLSERCHEPLRLAMRQSGVLN